MTVDFVLLTVKTVELEGKKGSVWIHRFSEMIHRFQFGYIDFSLDTSISVWIHRWQTPCNGWKSDRHNFLWQKEASGICPDGLTPHLGQLLGEVWSKNLKVRSEFWETQVSQKKSRYKTLGKTLGKFCQDKKGFVIESQNRSKTTLLTKSYKLHQLVCCLHL